MAAFSEGVFSSKLFIFVVGENRANISVHAAAVAQRSKALNSLVNGPMSESRYGRAVFEDVLEDTFVRFCQFAYTGDYETPTFIHRSKVAVSKGASVSAQKNLVKATAGDSEDSPKSSDGLLTRYQWNKKVYDSKTSQRTTTERCKVRPNENAEEDYRPVLLSHARLYVFADKWQIKALRKLSLHKLHDTLTTFTLRSKSVDDILKLLQYTYSDDNTLDRSDGIDELRELVVVYAAFEIKKLTCSSGFLELIQEGGSFARDLVLMMKRIK